jgi:hypothetical protein
VRTSQKWLSEEEILIIEEYYAEIFEKYSSKTD